MIRSMTGYGGAKGTVEGLSVTVELKSVNNRYLDIAVRMPRNFLFAEDAVKSTIQQHVSRGLAGGGHRPACERAAAARLY